MCRCKTNEPTVCVPNKCLSKSVVSVKDIDIKANRDEQLGLVSQSRVRSLGPTKESQLWNRETGKRDTHKSITRRPMACSLLRRSSFFWWGQTKWNPGLGTWSLASRSNHRGLRLCSTSAISAFILPSVAILSTAYALSTSIQPLIFTISSSSSDGSSLSASSTGTCTMRVTFALINAARCCALIVDSAVDMGGWEGRGGGTGACGWSALGNAAPGSAGIGAWRGADGPRGAPLPVEPLASMPLVPCWPN